MRNVRKPVAFRRSSAGVTRESPAALGLTPIVQTHKGLIVLVHPLSNVDGQVGHGLQTDHGLAMPVDWFNFDRRPGEVFRRL